MQKFTVCFLFFLGIIPIFHARYLATLEEFELINEIKEELMLEKGRKGKTYESQSENEAEEFKYYINYFLKSSSDAWILNWIRYYDYDMPKIKEKILKGIEFRRANKAEKLLDWKEPEFVRENFPFEITGLADDGTPVCYLYPAEWDAKGALAQGYKNEMVKYGVKMFETHLKVFNEEAKKINETTGKVPQEGIGSGTVIINLENISLSQLSIGVANFLAVMVRVYEEYYPLVADKLIMINSPTILTPLLRLLRRVVSVKTLDGIELYGNDPNKWRPSLLAKIQENLIPEFLLKD